jgi:hypothetical protein
VFPVDCIWCRIGMSGVVLESLYFWEIWVSPVYLEGLEENLTRNIWTGCEIREISQCKNVGQKHQIGHHWCWTSRQGRNWMEFWVQGCCPGNPKFIMEMKSAGIQSLRFQLQQRTEEDQDSVMSLCRIGRLVSGKFCGAPRSKRTISKIKYTSLAPGCFRV